MHVSKVKKRPTKRSAEDSKFWLVMFDPDTLEILTDGPVTTLVAPENAAEAA